MSEGADGREDGGMHVSQLPLNVRVREFLAEISGNEDKLVGTSAFDGGSNVGASGSGLSAGAPLSEKSPSSVLGVLGRRGAAELSRPIALGTRNTSEKITSPMIGDDMHGVEEGDADRDDDPDGKDRPKRYRNEKQKLSNSLAQKRYRERKKQAFSDMRRIIDTLTSEVHALRNVKTENQRLMHRVSALNGLVRSQQDQMDRFQDRAAHAPEPSASTFGLGRVVGELGEGATRSHVQIVQAPPVPTTPPSSVPKLAVPQLLQPVLARESQPQSAGPSVVIDQTGQPVMAGGVVLVAPESAQQRSEEPTDLEGLEREWESSIEAIEEIWVANSVQGLPNGPISEEALHVLSRMVSNLYKLSSRLTNAKIEKVVEEDRNNIERISRAFLGMTGCKQ